MAQFYNARHISTSSDYQIQETQWFEIVVEGIEDLTFLVQSCSLPDSSNSAVAVPYGNSTAYVAGKREYNTNTFTFMDAIKADIEGQLLQWQSSVYNPTNGKMGWVDEYKRTITVTEYGPNGSRERSWKFLGCWPESINYGSLTHESAGLKNISVTMRYDEVERLDSTPATTGNN